MHAIKKETNKENGKKVERRFKQTWLEKERGKEVEREIGREGKKEKRKIECAGFT